MRSVPAHPGMLRRMTIEYVDLETARAAGGTRFVVTSLVPSPWSEALKGLLAIAGLPALGVRRSRENQHAVDAWTGVDNVPAVMHEREPVRTSWAAIVGLVHRLAPDRGVLPVDVAARTAVMGTLELIAGEEGIGWSGRLAMIDASLSSQGSVGFPLPVAQFLARRYGYSPEAMAAARARVPAQLDLLAGELRGEYFGGPRPDAIDVYCAAFLTPLCGSLETECPSMSPTLRAAFDSAGAAFGPSVPAALIDHRERMFGRHLARPIVL